MAVSTSRLKIRKAQRKEAREVAEAAARQRARQKKRKGFLGKISGIVGGGLGSLIGGALGVASGGLLMPLIMGASTLAAKKGLDEATKKGVFGRGMMGYDPRDLKRAGKEFGYAEAQKGQEMSELKAGAKERSTIMGELQSAYAGAALGGLKGAMKGAYKSGGLKGVLGEFGKGKTWMGQGAGGVTGTGGGLFGKGMEGVKEYATDAWSGAGTYAKKQASQLAKSSLTKKLKEFDPTGGMGVDLLSQVPSSVEGLGRKIKHGVYDQPAMTLGQGNVSPLKSLGMGVGQSQEVQPPAPVGGNLDELSFGQAFKQEFASRPGETMNWRGQDYALEQAEDGGYIPKYQEGGNVQQQQMNTQPLSGQDLLGMLMSDQPQDKEELEDTDPRVPTIAEYFGSQGKTYTGTNTKSLSQMLGR